MSVHASTPPPNSVGLAEAVRALRSELEQAVAEGEGAEVQFEAKSIELEFQVGVTKSAEASGGVRFWVLELSGGGSYVGESVQKLTVTLDPVMRDGGSVEIASGTDTNPLGSTGAKG